MNIQPESGKSEEEGGNLYDQLKILVKRKRLFAGIFLVPLLVVTTASLIQPRYFRGESRLTDPVIPAGDIVALIGDIDATRKGNIFTNNPDLIKSVSVSLQRTSARYKPQDAISITIDAETSAVISQAFQDVYEYISNLTEVKDKIAEIKERTGLKEKTLREAKAANLLFLKQITDKMISNDNISFIGHNPADLIKKDGELSSALMELQRIKATAGLLDRPSIAREPSNSKIRGRIIATGLLSLIAGILIVSFLDYIDRMKERERG